MSTHAGQGRRRGKTGSDRAFGLVMAGFFAIVALWPMLSGAGPRLWSLALAAAFAAAALVRPALLAPANRKWAQLGMLLHRIVNPVLIGLLFALVFTPAGILARLFGKDLLGLRRRPDAATHWRRRAAASGSMQRQF